MPPPSVPENERKARRPLLDVVVHCRPPKTVARFSGRLAHLQVFQGILFSLSQDGLAIVYFSSSLLLFEPALFEQPVQPLRGRVGSFVAEAHAHVFGAHVAAFFDEREDSLVDIG